MEIEFNCNLNQIMYNKNLSFRQLEIMTDIGYSMLNSIANGTRTPSLHNIFAICLALGITFEELYSYKKAKGVHSP